MNRRIAIVGIAVESCTFSPRLTGYPDFKILRGAELAERYPFLVQAPFDDGTEWRMLLRATALPGGSVHPAAYQALKQDVLDALDAVVPLDAVCLDLHGAMHVQGLEDAELDLATAVRAKVGASCILGASTDLHGNLSLRLATVLDVITTYRTAPHIDEVETRERACRLIHRVLREGVRPVRAWIGLPTLLPGERTSTQFEPGRSLYLGLAEFERDPAIWDASLWVGYAWADEPRTGSAVVVTGTDAETVSRLARDLAAQYWAAREAFTFGVPSGSADECMDWALENTCRPVVISDSGDNPTAGGVGDVPYCLERLLERDAFQPGGKTAIYAAVADERACAALHQAGEGHSVSIMLGGHEDPQHGPPIAVTGLVQRVLVHSDRFGAQAVLSVGQVQIIITARRYPFHYLVDFFRLGLDPRQVDVLVVKMGYLVPELEACAAQAYLALTPGAVDQDIVRLPYRHVRRPVFPLDADMTWDPEPTLLAP